MAYDEGANLGETFSGRWSFFRDTLTFERAGEEELPTPYLVTGGLASHELTAIRPRHRRRRIELGITQEQLAERMGTSSSTVSRMESGQQVTGVTTLERLAAALEVKLLVDFESEAGDREPVTV